MELDLPHLTTLQQSQLGELLSRYLSLSDSQVPLGTFLGIQPHTKSNGGGPLCTHQWSLPLASRKLIQKECDAMQGFGPAVRLLPGGNGQELKTLDSILYTSDTSS